MEKSVNSKAMNQYRDYQRRIAYRTEYIIKNRNSVSLDTLLRINDTHLRAEHVAINEKDAKKLQLNTMVATGMRKRRSVIIIKSNCA